MTDVKRGSRKGLKLGFELRLISTQVFSQPVQIILCHCDFVFSWLDIVSGDSPWIFLIFSSATPCDCEFVYLWLEIVPSQV